MMTNVLMTYFELEGKTWTLRAARIVIPFVIAAGVAFTNAGCSGQTGENGENTGEGGAGGSGSSSGDASSSSGSGSSSGMIDCGDMQTDPQNCGMCGHHCAPGQTCAAGVCTCGMSSVAYADVQTILEQRCATYGCHSGALPKEGLDLSPGTMFDETVNVAANQCGTPRMLVLPGKPDQSYLINKLLGVDMCGPFAKRMPPAAALPMTDIQTISDWICGGALKN
jgi:hypothetical protein